MLNTTSKYYTLFSRQFSLLILVINKMSQTKSSCHSAYFGPATRLRSNQNKQVGVEKASVKSEIVPESKRIVSDSIAGKVSKQMKSKKIPDIKPKRPKLEVQWEPTSWKDQFENIRLMRKDKNAPVDTMGCERCTKDGYTEKVSFF